MKTIRILELTADLSVQVCGMLLSELGATVSYLKVPSPKSPAQSRLQNIDPVLKKGKHGLSFSPDFSLEDHQLKAQISSADIVLMGPTFSHAEAKRFATLAKRENALLIDIHMPAFPDDLSAVYGTANSEGAIAAATGLYTDISLFRSVLGLPPVYTDLPMPSIYGGVHGAIAALASIRSARATGTGDSVKVPLAAAVATSMASGILKVAGQPNRYDLPPVPRAVKNIVLPIIRGLARRGGPKLRQKITALGDTLFPPFMRSYTTADDKKLYLFAMDHDRLPAALLDSLGISHKLENGDITVTDPYSAASPDNLADPAMLAKPIKRELAARISEKIGAKPALFWEEKLTEKGIPFAIHNDFTEWCNRREVKDAGLVTSRIVTKNGDLTLPGKFINVAGASSPVSGGSAASAGKPLSGFRVLDLSTMVAGPVCARTMAELGADVIKIDSPTPHHGPRMTCWYGLEVNQGKKSVLLDISRQEGAKAFKQMLSSAHIVVHNFSEVAAKKLGVDAESLQQNAPHILLCSIGAFQGQQPGPWDNRKGYDPVVQAATGIQNRYGSKSSPQLHAIASCIDYLTGYMAAAGIMAALETGQKTVSVSLAQAAQLMQILYFSEKNSLQAPSGQNAYETDSDNRIYQTKDGYVFLTSTVDQSELLKMTLRICDNSITAREKAFKRKKTSVWLSLFQQNGIGLVRVNTTEDFLRLSSQTACLKTRKHPCGHEVTQLAQGHMTSELWKLVDLAPYQKPGHDTKAILAEALTSEQQTEFLFSCGTARTEWSEKYLP